MFFPEVQSIPERRVNDEKNERFYNMTQKQRDMERAIRKTKTELYNLNDKTGPEIEERRNFLLNLQERQMDRYTEFIDKNGQKLDDRRLQIYKGNNKKPFKEKIKENTKIAIAKKPYEDIGTLDENKTKNVKEKILTKDVVLTDERKNHINTDEHHLNQYDLYKDYMKEVVEDPNYIIRDKAVGFIVLLKYFEEEDLGFRMVIRLKKENDNPEYKNSITTFFNIDKDHYKKYERKYEKENKILYKKGKDDV